MKLNEDIIMRFESSKRTALAIFRKNEIFPEIFPVKQKYLRDGNIVVITDPFIINRLEKIKGPKTTAITFWEGIKGYQVKGNWKINNSGELSIEISEAYNVTPFKQEVL